ncbi:MAG: diacylglycerol/lipid kinase family protein [Rubrobacteraceae bacterium]
MESSKTRARAICNPSSGGDDYSPDQVREEFHSIDLEWIETENAGDAKKAAREWRDGLLIVVGGDGTVNEVINGIGEAGFPEGVTLGILPTGTGNDLAATLAIPEDPDEAEDTIRQNRVRTLDGEERRVRAVNIAIGNCRYAGGGWLAAPKANPEDGMLDVVVIEDVGVGGALALTPAALASSDYLDKEGIFSARARKIQVETRPEGFQFTADGELIGDEPATFEVIPRALKVIVGAGYVPEPVEKMSK